MSDTVKSLRLRLQRADQHFAQLNSEISGFIDSVRSGIRGEFNEESGEYVFWLTGEPPLEWGLLIGEWAHECRAVLDNVVSALVIKRGHEVTVKTAFIIANDYNRWNGGWGQDLWGLLKSDVALVKKRQPYIRGNKALDHPLSRLSWINNTDKHRLLHIAASATRLMPNGWPEKWSCFPSLDEPKGAIVGEANFHDPLSLTKASAVFCRVPLVNVGSNPKMHMDGDIPITVSLTGTERPLMLNDILDIRREVSEILAEFEPILTK